MAERGAYRVAVKPSAVEANGAVAALAADGGTSLAFESRAAAEDEAARLSERGECRVAIQRAAPQEPADVDAYLVADPQRRTHDPIEADDGRLTFGTTAAQYGALGEALVCPHPVNPPVLSAYVRDDLDGRTDGREGSLRVEVDPDPDPVVYAASDRGMRLAWVPDCVARARDGPDGPVLETYCCEVKTGDAAFQRHQATVMAYEARESTVLKVRVDVDGLPEAYTVRIDEVASEEPPVGLRRGTSPDARLDDFL